MKAGSVTTVPGLDGRWQVWSQCGDTPGAHFVVPFNEEAFRTGVKYAVIRAINKTEKLDGLTIEVLRTESSDVGRP